MITFQNKNLKGKTITASYQSDFCASLPAGANWEPSPLNFESMILFNNHPIQF